VSPKPKILGAKPTLNKDGKVVDTKPAVKPVVPQAKPQYNSPAGLYSGESKTQSLPPLGSVDSAQNKLDGLQDPKTSVIVETSRG